MKTVNLLSFRKNDIESIVTKLGNTVKNKKIFDENGNSVKCEVCGTEITTENLGNIIPGSKRFFCDNPACFAKFIEEIEE